jgi:hypothetical protein
VRLKKFSLQKFFAQFEEWFNGEVTFIIENITVDVQSRALRQAQQGGRPSVRWDELTHPSKQRRAEAEPSTTELVYATQISMRAAGPLGASKVVKDIVEGSPSQLTRYLGSVKHGKPNFLSASKALSLSVECKLSKSEYNCIFSVSLEKNCKFYTSYEKVRKEKCYPENIVSTESGASVTLQLL